MSKEFSQRQKFIESCNSLILELDNQDLNENIITDYAKKLFDNIKTTKEIADFYKKLLTNNKALQLYLNNLITSIKQNISAINNEYLNKLLNTLNNSTSLKNLIYLSTIACITAYYIKFSANIPNLAGWANNILQSQLVSNINLDSILQFFEMLIKIVGSIIFIYEILIAPYKNEILSIVGNFILLKKESLTESKFTNYNKRNMKKVLITESQLRGMVRKMLNEMDGMSMGIGTSGFKDEREKGLMNTSTEGNIDRIIDRSPQLTAALQKDPSVVGSEIDGIFFKILKSMNIEAKNLPNIKAGLMNAYNKLVQEKTPQLRESRQRRRRF